MDLLLGSLADFDGLLDRDEPAVPLGVVGRLEGVAASVKLEGELMRRLLLQVGGIVEIQHSGGAEAVGVTFPVEEQEAFAGLAGPGNDGVGDLGLLAAHVEVQVLSGDGVIAQPEFLLGWDERSVELD